MERDIQLDIYRALSIMLVVGLCHVLYWLELGSEPWMSIMLVEMPIIFFISGASQSVVNKRRSIWEVICSRVKRVILPYYVYALIMVLFVIVKYDITEYTLRDCWSIIIGARIPQSPFSWHLWFILPYFLLSIFFEAQKRMFVRLRMGG